MAKCTDGVGTIKFLESTSQMCDELKLSGVVLGSVSSGKGAVLTISAGSAPNNAHDLGQPLWAFIAVKSGNSE